MTTPRPRLEGSLRLGAALLLALGAAGPARAGEAYYVLVFASQRIPNNPNYSHTFATFVRAAWPGDEPCPGPEGACLEAHTISWLPCTGRVKTRAMRPECGRNFSLDETIRLALAGGQRVSLWGPYQVRADLYGLALRRIAELEAGGVLYKANDSAPARRPRQQLHPRRQCRGGRAPAAGGQPRLGPGRQLRRAAADAALGH